MNCKQANSISLNVLIPKMGYKLLRYHKNHTEAFYENPLRTETDPSFSVNLVKNLWYDHGLAKGGSVVDLIMVKENLTLPEALHWITHNLGTIVPDIRFSTPSPIKSVPQRFTFLYKKPLFSYALKQYLKDRKIDLNIVNNYIQEIRFRDNDTKTSLYSIGIMNNSGGYNLRNKLAKTIITPNDITYITSITITETLLVFEGLFDFLAYLMITQNSVLTDDVLILNTLSYAKKAAAFIKNKPNIKNVISFLDHPKYNNPRSLERYNEAILSLSTSTKNLYLANETFMGYSDLAEYWEQTQSLAPIRLQAYH